MFFKYFIELWSKPWEKLTFGKRQLSASVYNTLILYKNKKMTYFKYIEYVLFIFIMFLF